MAHVIKFDALMKNQMPKKVKITKKPDPKAELFVPQKQHGYLFFGPAPTKPRKRTAKAKPKITPAMKHFKSLEQ